MDQGRPTWWERRHLQNAERAEFKQLLKSIEAMAQEQETIGRSDLRRAQLNLNLDPHLLSSWGGIFAVLVRKGVLCHATKGKTIPKSCNKRKKHTDSEEEEEEDPKKQKKGAQCGAGNEGRFAHRNKWLPDLDWNPPSIEEANLTLAKR